MRDTLVPVTLGLTALVVHLGVGHLFYDDWTLQLGSLRQPVILHLVFMMWWAVFGSAAALGLGLGLGRLLTRADAARRSAVWLAGTADRTWMLGVGAAALAIPALLRQVVLEGAVLTDDETAYRLMAKLLARGQLTIESPEMKLFFDRDFLINNGDFYSQYFLGWPAMMAPGVALNVSGYMNALYAALTVPALFWALRRMAGSGWARAGTLLYLSSPLLMTVAATELSHTSCLFLLTWCLWWTLRSRDEGAPAWVDAGLGAAFAGAFFIRPSTALGIGGPLLVYWAWGLKRSPDRMRRLAAFCVPSGALAAAFLGVNNAQNGSPFQVAYGAEWDYHVSNGYRYCRVPFGAERAAPNMQVQPPLIVLIRNATAALRLNFALFGWPCSFAAALLAGSRGPARLLWSMLASFFAVHLLVADAGVDTFGPVHYTEVALPLLGLSVLGLKRATDFLAGLNLTQAGGFDPRVLPAAFAAAAVLTALPGYHAVRWKNANAIAQDHNRVFKLLEAQELDRAIIFTPRKFNRPCESSSWNLWSVRQPVTHPALDPVLFVNHIDIETDRAFNALHPDRPGFLLHYVDDCTPTVIPIDAEAIDQYPPSLQVIYPDADEERG